MELNRTSTYGIIFTIFCILSGVFVAIYISPKNSFFWGNFKIFWFPQAVVLMILFFTRYKTPIICGAALLLSIYLAIFNFWISSSPNPESMAWLGYSFSFPGAAIGALISAPIVNKFGIKNSFILGSIGFLLTLIGLALNQSLICTTVMLCSM